MLGRLLAVEQRAAARVRGKRPRLVEEVLDRSDASDPSRGPLELLDQVGACHLSAEKDGAAFGVHADAAFRDARIPEQHTLDLVRERGVVELRHRGAAQPVNEPVRVPTGEGDLDVNAPVKPLAGAPKGRPATIDCHVPPRSTSLRVDEVGGDRAADRSSQGRAHVRSPRSRRLRPFPRDSHVRFHRLPPFDSSGLSLETVSSLRPGAVTVVPGLCAGELSPSRGTIYLAGCRSSNKPRHYERSAIVGLLGCAG
jgi:hypothetical protein